MGAEEGSRVPVNGLKAGKGLSRAFELRPCVRELDRI